MQYMETKVYFQQENMGLPAAEIRGNCTFMETFAALLGLCVLLQGRWNDPLAYRLLSSVCWQPASPGDLAYRQQMKQIGNYSVISSPDWCSTMGPFLSNTLFLAISPQSVSLYFSFVSVSWSLPCHHFPAICVHILTCEFVYYMENEIRDNETKALRVSEVKMSNPLCARYLRNHYIFH